jgi:hypothetical protein
MKSGLVPILLCLCGCAAAQLGAPVNLRADYSEKCLDLVWDSVPGATGYNVYTRPCTTAACVPRRVNKRLITSGTHFAYLWDLDSSERTPAIKGVEHHLAVTAVCSTATGVRESEPSLPIDNCYFEGFRNATRSGVIERILATTQRADTLPIALPATDKRRFIAFMEMQGRLLSGIIQARLDAREVGGCEPIATILAQALLADSIPSVKAEGLFIKEFHAFVIVNIDRVEYVLDFAADQFVPDVAPVMVPRDRCFLNARGRLDTAGTPVYPIATLLPADQCRLSDGKQAAMYREIQQALQESLQNERANAQKREHSSVRTHERTKKPIR